MISSGKKICLAFELTVEGKLIKIVHSGKPISYVQGKKSPLFPRALGPKLSGMRIGQRRRVMLSPKQGYGTTDTKLIMIMPRKRFAVKYHFIGRSVISEKDGKHLAFVKEVRKDVLVLDFNHPLAGKNLQYDVLVVGIEGEGMMSQEARGKL